MGANGVNLDGIKQVDTLVRQNPAMGKVGFKARSSWKRGTQSEVTVDSILAKLARCRQTLEQIQPGCTGSNRRKRLSS